MKTNLTLILCFLWSSAVFSQNLLHSRQSSLFTYLYQISNAEAEQICGKADWDVYPQFFHTLRDSFPTDSTLALDLPPGHYLQTSIVKNRLSLDLLTVLSFDVVMLNNSADLCIAVYDTLGRVLPDAELRVGDRRVVFSGISGEYGGEEGVGGEVRNKKKHKCFGT